MINVDPPKDAMGREIPLSTKVLYYLEGNMFEVESFNYFPKGRDWTVSCSMNGLNLFTFYAYKLLLYPPDSWEKLEHDATLAPRDYLKARGLEEHKDGRIATMMSDLVSRAKALAERERKND